MTIGKGGIYEDLAAHVLKQSDADAVCVIVFGGNRARDAATHEVQLLAESALDAARQTEKIIGALQDLIVQLRRDVRQLRAGGSTP